MPPPVPRPPSPGGARLLLGSVLIVATCGLIYELLSATMASYLLGDSITQFSLVIGVYLSAMGLGSYLSKGVKRDLYDRFIAVQLVVAVVGGLSAIALFFGYAWLSSVRPLLFGILIVVGTMVGLEIPLLIRILKDSGELGDLVARVLAFDYLGALAASVLFPLALLPTLGLSRTGLLFGGLNALVATACAFAFRDQLRRPRALQSTSLAIAAALGLGLALGGRLERIAEEELFDAPLVRSEKSAYQRLSITREGDDVRLYIDGNLQFSSLDEHRYHEALVHPALSEAEAPARVLVLGGGDGLALREILKHPSVEAIDLVDLDPKMTGLFTDDPLLRELNEGSLADPRVTIHNADAMRWLEAHVRGGGAAYDAVLVDLPDPNNFSLGKLYSGPFYRLVGRALRPGGSGVIQATSPLLSPRAFWCVVTTLADAGLHPRPYHAHVPTFGDWGFVMIAHEDRPPPTTLAPVALRYLDEATLAALFVFPRDQRPAEVEPNRLSDQLLVHYYEEDLRSIEQGRRRAR
ncbi:MAG: polyamine aminopropyltransferase [Nannocystaceae bacterium]